LEIATVTARLELFEKSNEIWLSSNLFAPTIRSFVEFVQGFRVGANAAGPQNCDSNRGDQSANDDGTDCGSSSLRPRRRLDRQETEQRAQPNPDDDESYCQAD
jgi:hypothetical protein